MSKGKDTLILLLILTNFVLGGFLYKAMNKEVDIRPKSVGSVVVQPEAVSNRDSQSRNRLSFDSNETNDTNASRLSLEQNLDRQLESKALDKNTHAKLKFSSIAQFKADFPDDFSYILYEDIDEDVLLLEGRLNDSDTYSAMMATKAIIKPEQVVSVLKSNPDMLPGLTDNLSWINDRVQPKKLEGPLPAGIGDVYFWRAEGGDSNAAAFVYGIRDDKKGSYFFLVHGPSGYLDNNEGKFEKFLSSMKITK